MKEPPFGYQEVYFALELSKREYEILMDIRFRSAKGNWSAAVRKQMGWPERPHGIIAAEKRANDSDSQVT